MKSVFVKKLIFSKSSMEELVSQLCSAEYSSENGEGVRILNSSENCVACQFLFEKVYSQNTYNIETGEFDKIEFKRVDCIPTFVDLQHFTLDIIGNKQQAARVIEYFGRITRYKIGIEDAQINLLKLLQSCVQNKINFNITKVKIAEYAFFDNIVGECSLNLYGYSKALDVIKKYKQQITNITVSINVEDPYLVTFHKSGAIVFYKDADSIDLQMIRILKLGL